MTGARATLCAKWGIGRALTCGHSVQYYCQLKENQIRLPTAGKKDTDLFLQA